METNNDSTNDSSSSARGDPAPPVPVRTMREEIWEPSPDDLAVDDTMLKMLLANQLDQESLRTVRDILSTSKAWRRRLLVLQAEESAT